MSFRQEVSAFVSLARLENALLPSVAVMAGAVAVGSVTNSSLCIRVVVLVLLHSVVTILNDIADEATDRYNGITRIAAIKRAGAYSWLVTLTSVAIALALIMAAFLPLDVIGLVVFYLLLGWLYNLRPVQASRRPIASIVTLALAYGLIPFLMGSGVRLIGLRIWLLAISWMLVRASLSLLKDYKDAVGDAKADKRTFLLVFGNRMTVRLSLTLALVGYTGCVTMTGLSSNYRQLAVLTLSVIAAWLMYERSRLLHKTTYAQLNRLFHSFLQYELLFDCLVVVWLHTR